MNYSALGSTGLRVSRLGFGASPLGDVFRKTDPAEGSRAVQFALDEGINFFDVAPYYGLTLAEERLGQALEGRRHEAILATKCGRYGTDFFDFSPARIRSSLEDSLRRLRTDYVDLFQAHDIEFVSARQIIEEAIPTMRALQREGKVRFVGITGLQLGMLKRTAQAAPVDTILSYCRYNLMNTRLNDELAPFASEQGIGLINASPLHMGILTDAGPPRWHPAPEAVKAAGASASRLCAASGVRIQDIALRFAIGHPAVATTLVGMGTANEVHENMRAAAKPLDIDLVSEIRQAIGAAADRNWGTGLPENQD
jgi:L-galactose dehydrogenase